MRLATRAVGDGPPVVWLHGYTMDSTLWDELWSLLPGHRHVGVDLPGHGGSDPMPPGTTLPEVASAVAEIADGAGARALVALSFGTTVALQVALDHPSSAERLVLAAPALGGAPEEPGTRERYRQLTVLRRMGGTPADLAGCWMAAPPDIFRGAQGVPQVHSRIRDVVTRHAWGELATGGMQAVVRHPQAGRLGELTAGVCVLVGEDDLVSTRQAVALMNQSVQDVVVHEIAQAGHLCLLERPHASAPILADHLTAADQAI